VFPVGLVIANQAPDGPWRRFLIAATLAIFPIGRILAYWPRLIPLKMPIKAFSGFSQPVVITLLSLFIITRGLDKSGITRWLASQSDPVGWKPGRPVDYASRGHLSFFIAVYEQPGSRCVAAAWSYRSSPSKRKLSPVSFLIPIAYGSLLGRFCHVFYDPQYHRK